MTAEVRGKVNSSLPVLALCKPEFRSYKVQLRVIMIKINITCKAAGVMKSRKVQTCPTFAYTHLNVSNIPAVFANCFYLNMSTFQNTRPLFYCNCVNIIKDVQNNF